MTNNIPDQPGTAISQQLFNAMATNSTEIVLMLDAGGSVLYAGPSVHRVAGYQPGQLLGKNLSFFLCDDDATAYAAAWARVLDNAGTPIPLSLRFKHAAGDLLWMEGRAVNMLGVEGVNCVVLNLSNITLQKEAENKLFAGELKLRSLIENSHDGIALMSAEGKMIYLSSAIARIMGFTAEELLGTDPRLLSHPDDLEPVAKVLEWLYPRFGQTAVAEYRMRHKNGSWRWIKSNITNLLHEAHIGALVFNYEDITERRTREELLRQSERMMADAQKIAHFGSWELDIKTGVLGELRWSDEVYRIFGYSPGEIKISADIFFASVYPDDVAEVRANTIRSIAENSRYSIDHRIVWPDGAIRWVHEDAQLMTDEVTGEPYKLTGTVQDITARKEAEDKALAYEANLRTIFDNTEIGYTTLDNNFNIVTFNPRAAAWIQSAYNVSLREGSLFTGYIKDVNEAGRLKALLKRVLFGENIKFDYHLKNQADGDTWYIIRMNPIIAHDKKIHGICLAISDITLRKQQELEREKIAADLIQRNKDLEQFAYVISHNLRAPLTNIMGLTHLLIEHEHPAEEEKTYVKQLAVSVQKMDVIIRDLNHILQVKKDLGEVKQPVYFSSLVNDIKESIENIISREGAAIITDFAEADGFLTVKSYIYSIFYNLIINSVKYRQPGIAPVIEIKSTLRDKRLELIFKDNGLGIDLRRRGKEVFGLYKRFHHHIEGKGMGLFMVKTQAETIGGTIHVQSEVNNGTIFTISFPVE